MSQPAKCAWCPTWLLEGEPIPTPIHPPQKVSHGICPECLKKQLAEVDRVRDLQALPSIG